MWKKTLFAIFLIIGLAGVSFGIYEIYKFSSEVKETLNPTSKTSKQTGKEKIEEPTKVSKDKMFSVLLLGIDRRSKSETAFRTDIMILVSVNQSKKRVVLTSVPRDLWVSGGRINATYINAGWPAMQDAFETITGQKPVAYIQCDFEDLVWIVDAMGGLDIEIDTAFTDTEYPNDITKTYKTVSYSAGKQHIDGTNALILSRSRHGNNGEGSDFKRMIRQHKILKSMQDAIVSARSLFNPFDIKTFYNEVTAPEHMSTNLSLGDAKALWDFYPQRNDYTIEDFYVDSEYLYNPPLSEYGGAWVLIPKNKDYTPIHLALLQKLGLIETPKEDQVQPKDGTENAKTQP